MRYNYNTPAWWLAIILSHITSPLAVCWHLLTGRDLYLQIGTFTYSVEARHQSGQVRWGHFFYRPKPESRPRPIHYEISSGRVRVYERTFVRIFSRCPKHMLGRDGLGHVSHSVGPVEIGVGRCDPHAPPFPPPPKQLAELVEAGQQMPVYGLLDSPLGLAFSGQAGSNRVQRLSLTFSNRPAANENPVCTEEYLHEIRLKMREPRDEWPEQVVRDFDSQLQKRGIKLSHQEIFRRYESSSVPPRLPPVPTKALELDSFYKPLHDETPAEVRDQILEYKLEIMTLARKLFANLSRLAKDELSEHRCKEFCANVENTLQRYAPDLVDEIAASAARATKRQFVIDGTEFSGEMLYWPQPHPLCAFRLEQSEALPDVSCLGGTGYGIALEDLLPLLDQLVVINNRADLIAQYQNELDQYNRLRRARLQGGDEADGEKQGH